MAESAIRELELRLLRCTLLPTATTPITLESSNSRSLLSQAEKIVALIEKGDYLEALGSDSVLPIFNFANSWSFEDSVDCADRFYAEAERSVERFLRIDGGGDEEQGCRAVLVMCVGVAAFLVFTQCNVTGPSERFPSFPFPSQQSKDDEFETNGAEWTRGHYMVYAKLLLMKISDLSINMENALCHGTKSIFWWLCRILLLQQRILDENSASLFDLLQVFKVQTLRYFGELENVESYWGSKLHVGEASTIVTMAHVEAGMIEYTYSRVDAFRQHCEYAEQASRLHLSVTGVLGFRTLHQAEAKAQMVLVANSIMPKTGGRCPSDIELKKSVLSNTGDETGLCSHETKNVSDILRTPKLLTNGNNTGYDANGCNKSGTDSLPLEADQQAVILASCLLVEKNTPHDEMHDSKLLRHLANKMGVYSESHESACLDNDGKIGEAASLMHDGEMERQERSRISLRPLLPIPVLKKDYGELLVGCGMVGEALKIFEELELWDSLIFCYGYLGNNFILNSLLEKKAAAAELIKARLCEMPNDPRLWCSLGDVTNNEAYYEKALEVSNNKSARAKRSLARGAYNRGDFEASKILWESAMALNSLYTDGWFALGAAALKARDIDKALYAFTCSVKLDPDNGEAWNNIACLHMMKKRSKEAFIAFKEALKYRRNSWQLWENYSQVAADIRNFGQALQATKMVLDMTSYKRIDADLLERVLMEVEAQTSRFNLSSNGGVAVKQTPDSYGKKIEELHQEEPDLANSRETNHLMEVLGDILKQIVRSGKGDNIWGLYARWHRMKGDLTMCSEALLKQVRSYQGADLWNNKDRFKKFANASLQLCKVYMEISASTGSRRELNAAEMHLRNSIKQASNFSETEELKALEQWQVGEGSEPNDQCRKAIKLPPLAACEHWISIRGDDVFHKMSGRTAAIKSFHQVEDQVVWKDGRFVHRVQWSVGDVDYNEWASSQSFHPGDTLVFEYHAHSHNVMQVNPSDFKSCNSTAPPLAVYTSGNDAVTFKMAGNYYFICGAPGHCEAGQKVEIKVVTSSQSSSMSGASRPALSPSALSPMPPHTSSAAVNYAASGPLLFGLLGIASSIVFKFVLFALFHVSAGAVHRVQWLVGDVDYNEWASSQSFHPGDTLVFEYNAHSHNVMQVNPSDFKSCNSTAPPLAVYTSGNDAVTFKMAGNYYFICGAPGHCEASQKVEIKVVPSSPSSSRPALSPSALSPIVPPPTKVMLSIMLVQGPLSLGYLALHCCYQYTMLQSLPFSLGYLALLRLLLLLFVFRL
ncbi:hypothetical protein Syun_029153 [Stephania yunnanensis]|uniref:Phytocyanin domain-containing protein n=1 Tax=Stephania yunnanensis TaxID=152371 RepID=A0AAP0HH25_9MAGN